MTARITFCATLVLLIGIRCTPALSQYYQQQPTQQYSPAAQPATQAVPAQGVYQGGPSQQYPQIVGPPRPVYPPAQSGMQSAGSPQGAYQGVPGQPVPPSASAIVPQNTPTLQRRGPQMVNQVFPQLTPEQQAEVDAVLKKWEEASRQQKRITIEFNRYEYNAVFASKRICQGKADFASSGKWMWTIRGEWVDNKVVEGQRAELMVFDGQSIYEFDYSQKTVTQHVLADDLKGEDMVRAMLPFLFGTDMNKLKQRYFIRLLKVADEKTACLEAWPRFQDEARNFTRAQMIIDLSKMEPTALKLAMPDGNTSYSYEFTKVDINPKNPLDLLNDPFKVRIPSGWATHVEQLSTAEVGNRPPASVMR